MNHINWEEIRNKYIYGIQKDGKFEFPSTRDLANEYGIAPAGVMDHSAKGGWVKARKQYLSERRAKIEQKVAAEISEEIVPFDTDLFNKAKEILGELDNLLIEKPNDALILANTLKSLKDVEKAVLGEGDKGGGNDRTEDIEQALESLRSAIESSKDNDL